MNGSKKGYPTDLGYYYTTLLRYLLVFKSFSLFTQSDTVV